MYKFINKPLQFHLNNFEAMKVHVSDASRLGCGSHAIILNLPQQKRSAMALEAILVSSLSLIDQNLKLRISDICEHAGVSIGTFYIYFKNIEHLLKYLHFLHLKECEDSLTEISKSNLLTANKIIKGAESIYHIHSSNRILHRYFKEEIENNIFSTKIIQELKNSIMVATNDSNFTEKKVANALHFVKPWVENDQTYHLGLDKLKKQLYELV